MDALYGQVPDFFVSFGPVFMARPRGWRSPLKVRITKIELNHALASGQVPSSSLPEGTTLHCTVVPYESNTHKIKAGFSEVMVSAPFFG